MTDTDYLISRFYNRTTTKVEIGDVISHIDKKHSGKVTAIGHNGVMVKRTGTNTELVWPYNKINLRFKSHG